MVARGQKGDLTLAIGQMLGVMMALRLLAIRGHMSKSDGLMKAMKFLYRVFIR